MDMYSYIYNIYVYIYILRIHVINFAITDFGIRQKFCNQSGFYCILKCKDIKWHK